MGGKSLSGRWGVLVNPPTLTMEFFSRPIHRLTVVGDSLRGEYPVDFTIKLWDSNNKVLYTEEATGNDKVDWQKAINPINQIVKMTLEIHRWSHINRVVKIVEFFTSVQETYEGDDILLINLLEEREFSNGSLPIGNISANEIEVRLNNIDRKFDAGNQESSLYELLKANRRIKAWIGVEITETKRSFVLPFMSVEEEQEPYIQWIPLGVFWSGDWLVPENEVYAHTTGRDRLELLRKSTYSTSQVDRDTNLYELAEKVLMDAEVEDYWIDEELKEFPIPYAYFESLSHREALRQISEACIGQCYCDRSGAIRLEGPSFLANERTEKTLDITKDDYFTLDQHVQWSQIANYIEVETQPLRPLPVQEVYRSNDPYSISAGATRTLTVFFNEPPVIDAEAIIEGDGMIQSATYYAWGANVTVYSIMAGEFTLVVNGRPLTIINKERAIAQDEDSIIDNGRLTYTFPKNHLVQRLDVAQKIADKLLYSFKNPRRDISISWRGNPALELADKITAPDFDRTADFYVTSQTLEYDGGLNSTVTGRRS